MADVVKFCLSCVLKNVVDEGGKVVVADLVPTESPEVLESTVRVQVGVLAGIVITASVA